MGYLLIILAVLISVAVYLRVISPFLTGKYLEGLIANEPQDSPALIPKALRAFMPRRCVLTSLSLPIPGRAGEEIAYGTVAVSRAGIFIVSRICGSGLIENPPAEERWRFMSHGRVKEFPNPFREQADPRRLLALYAAAVGVENVKVHTLVVYTDGTLRFSHPPSKGTVHISQIYKRMKKLSSKGRLSYKSVRAIANALNDADGGITPFAE